MQKCLCNVSPHHRHRASVPRPCLRSAVHRDPGMDVCEFSRYEAHGHVWPHIHPGRGRVEPAFRSPAGPAVLRLRADRSRLCDRWFRSRIDGLLATYIPGYAKHRVAVEDELQGKAPTLPYTSALIKQQASGDPCKSSRRTPMGLRGVCPRRARHQHRNDHVGQAT